MKIEFMLSLAATGVFFLGMLCFYKWAFKEQYKQIRSEFQSLLSNIKTKPLISKSIPQVPPDILE